MPSAYINALRRDLEAVGEPVPRVTPDLRQRFVSWFNGQPDISRLRAYSMLELERAMNTQGRFLSPILVSLGWERRRQWSSKGPNSRYWVPPGGGTT